MRIVGRTTLIGQLAAHARDAHAVLIYGPRGVGASIILDGCEAKLGASGRIVIRISRLATYAELVEPVMRAYGDGQRLTKDELHARIERRPGAILVDRLERAGAKVRREIRELTAAGLGVIIAGQADTPREHARLRAQRIAHRELAIPPLDRGDMIAVLDSVLPAAIAARLVDADRERILSAASGRPGILAALVRQLGAERYWRDHRAAVDLAVLDLAVADIASLRSVRRR